MVARRASASKSKRGAKRGAKRTPVVAPVDYAATTVDYSSSPMMDEESYSSPPSSSSSSSSSMIGYLFLLLELAAVAYAWYVTYEVWKDPKLALALATREQADAYAAKQYAYLALATMLSLMTLFTMYKMFVSS